MRSLRMVISLLLLLNACWALSLHASEKLGLTVDGIGLGFSEADLPAKVEAREMGNDAFLGEVEFLKIGDTNVLLKKGVVHFILGHRLALGERCLVQRGDSRRATREVLQKNFPDDEIYDSPLEIVCRLSEKEYLTVNLFDETVRSVELIRRN